MGFNLDILATLRHTWMDGSVQCLVEHNPCLKDARQSFMTGVSSVLTPTPSARFPAGFHLYYSYHNMQTLGCCVKWEILCVWQSWSKLGFNKLSLLESFYPAPRSWEDFLPKIPNGPDYWQEKPFWNWVQYAATLRYTVYRYSVGKNFLKLHFLHVLGDTNNFLFCILLKI